jgi:ELWxxDGT repeat protein
MKFSFTLLLTVAILAGYAQNFTRISDINTSGDAGMTSPYEFQGKLFFVSHDDANGLGIYYTDGSLSGTQLLKTIAIYAVGSPGRQDFIEYNGRLFFLADDGTHGYELWATDGTTSGTQMVKDIAPGISNAGISIDFGMVLFNNKLFFIANDGMHGRELWVSDGTTNGTNLIKDINANGDAFVSTVHFTLYNGILYFIATDVTNGHPRVWKTDGTATGTVFADLAWSDLGDKILAVLNGKLWITSTSTNPFKPSIDDIYISDGTPSGTYLLADSANSFYNNSQSFYFYINNYGKMITDGIHALVKTDTAIYISDGTANGTKQVKGINSFQEAIFSNGSFYLADTGIYRLTTSDGSLQFLTATEGKANFIECNGKVCFLSSLGNFGREPWVTDGTAAGTFRLKDTNPGSSDGIELNKIWNGISYNNKFYFTARNVNWPDSIIWVTDGTIAGTQRILHPKTVQDISLKTVYNNCLFFNSEFDNAGYETWKLCEPLTDIYDVQKIVVKVSPNPSHGEFSISADISSDFATVVVLNNLGQKITALEISKAELFRGKSIFLPNVADGLYIVSVITGDSALTVKLYVER